MLRKLVCLLLLAGLAQIAAAEPRYALLIGNEDYPATVGPLSLPHEDVDNIRTGLLQAGFAAEDIKVLRDATQMDINLAVAQLASDLRAGGPDSVGFFYYSGHGGSAESAGTRANYLIPAKSPITGAEQLPILGVAINSIVDTLAATEAKAVFVVSDACRNTLPFTSSKGGAADKGMVRVPRKRGLFIAFATADGATTPDDGLFSKALARRLPERGLSADRAFTLALREVSAARPGNAMPFTADGLTEDICFTSCDAAPSPVTAGNADLAYVAATQVNTVDAYLDFIGAWPDSRFVRNAQEGIVTLFYDEAPSAKKFEAPYDIIKGPPALLEAFHQFAVTADSRDQTDTAFEIWTMMCQSGFARSCTAVAKLIDEGVMNARFKDSNGTIDSKMREEAILGGYQGGCVFGDQAACDWLAAKGHDRWPACDEAIGTDAITAEIGETFQEVGVSPVPGWN
ncbi:MAG: caspase family protein [Hyphomonas sp.]|nr:caspase family protein [Hyphomonas sp.]